MLALYNLLRPERLTAVVDIVSAFKVDDNPPYQRMLAERACSLTTFPVVEPIPPSTPLDLLKITGLVATAGLLRAGPNKVAAQVTAAFFPRYTFGEIDSALREAGLILHCFAEACIAPVLTNVPVPNPDPHQFAQADVIYIRDITRPMSVEQWKHLALIAHHVCGSFDVAMYCIAKLVALDVVPADSETQYQSMLRSL